jgi:GNAT superfamily N-acetyltransferase
VSVNLHGPWATGAIPVNFATLGRDPHPVGNAAGRRWCRLARMSLDIVVASGPLLDEWRAIHNAIIPTAQLSTDDVADRSTHHRLTLAYVGDQLVGNATVRPPREPDRTATVIVRILPAHRRKGHGSIYLEAELAAARALSARRIETVVLASNLSGLAFAQAHGFVEHDRYIPRRQHDPVHRHAPASRAARPRLTPARTSLRFRQEPGRPGR